MRKSLHVGVSFLRQLTEQSFISHYMLQLYNKRTPARALHCKFWKIFRFLPEHPPANTFVPFRRLWDFTITLKTVATFLPLRQLPLSSPTKTIIIWNSKQIKTLYNQWFRAALPNIKFWIFIRKCQRWSPVYTKSWGNKSNLSDISRVVILKSTCKYLK